MKIVKLLYLKYSLSFLICLICSFIIFFIFSLFGNLNEDYLFNIIINLSFLNTLQILMYVPSFVFLISVILFITFLKSKNEIVIIKSYISIKKLLLFFLPIVFIFTILEINKKDFAEFIDISKTNLLKYNDSPKVKVIIKDENKIKTFVVLKNISYEDIEGTEYRSYKVFKKKIQEAQFSNNLMISNNTLIAKNYTKYSDDLIKDIDFQHAININLSDLIQQNSIVKDISIKNNYEFNIKLFNLFIFYMSVFFYIFLIFSNKKYVSTKVNLSYPISISLIFLLYSFIIFNNSLNFFKQEFEVLASIVVGMVVIKEIINE